MRFKQTDFLKFQSKQRRTRLIFIASALFVLILLIAFLVVFLLFLKNGGREQSAEQATQIYAGEHSGELIEEPPPAEPDEEENAESAVPVEEETASAEEDAGGENIFLLGADGGAYYDSNAGRLYTGGLDVFAAESNFALTEHKLFFDDSQQRSGRVGVGDGLVDDITIADGNVTITCATGCFVEFFDEDGELFLQLTDPKTIYETVVVIDAGHGGIDNGTEIAKPLLEKNVNLEIVRILLDIFVSEKILLLPTRSDDTRISIEDRNAFANGIGDYLISVHNNADEASSRSSGTVVYYAESGFDFPISSKELALIVQDALVNKLGTRDRGINHTIPFRLLGGAEIPAVIAEVMFLSNPEERERLSDHNTLFDIAGAFKDAVESLPAARSH